MDKKYNVSLIEKIVKERLQNPFRYYVAIGLIQDGRSYADHDVSRLTHMLGVTSKTLSNNIQKLANKGWVRVDPKKERLYLMGQKKLAQSLGVDDPSRKAVYINANDLGADIVDWRAYLYKATVGASERTIARETLRSKTGHCRRTQRKYEKKTQITKRFNYAIIAQYENERQVAELHYEENVGRGGLFVSRGHVIRQIPNTYYTDISLGYRTAVDHNECVLVGTRSQPAYRYLTDDNVGNKPLDINRVYVHVKGGMWTKKV